MKEKWIEDLREGLSDFEMDAPEGLWESLGVEESLPVRPWRRKIAAAAAILALLTAGSGILIWLSQEERFKVSPTGGSVNRVAACKPSSECEGIVPTYTDPTATEMPRCISATVIRNTGVPANGDNEEPTYESSSYGEEDMPVSNTTDNREAEEKPADTDISSIRNHNTEKGKPLYAGIVPKKKNSGKYGRRFALAAYASGIGQAAESMGRKPGGNTGDGPIWSDPGLNNPGAPDVDPNDPPFTDSNGVPEPDSPGDNPTFGQHGEPTATTEIHHHQPIKAGLTVQYNLTDRVGIETGLMYTALASDIMVSQGKNASSGRREMHYIGIPLNVKLSLWSWKAVDLYLSAGAMGEKCLSNRFETKHTAEGLSLDQYSRQKERPFQWSVNAAGGLQIKPLPGIGIFVEPGVSYYFNDGTSLSTIYKERPCNFNLNVGVRFNFHK
ncbi:MAG: outer membrane beta-barrel protein [Muribaculaceae bacterium]|nr:outer membrane beta-barrel protein [Muribaculaceae bacterium]